VSNACLPTLDFLLCGSTLWIFGGKLKSQGGFPLPHSTCLCCLPLPSITIFLGMKIHFHIGLREKSCQEIRTYIPENTKNRNQIIWSFIHAFYEGMNMETIAWI
jgi:hypothetical protein